MKLTKQIIKVGNSAGVILPREWCGGKARVELIEKPLNIKKDILEILDPYLENILGVYIVGSYARGEQTADSDVDVLVISDNINKRIERGKYEISIYPVNKIKKTLKKNPIMIYPRLIEGKTILNDLLLKELQAVKISKNQFKEFIGDCKSFIKMDKEFLELDKLEGDLVDSNSVIYSLILRLRAMFLIKGILNNKVYSKKEFKKWLINYLQNKEDFQNAYLIYEGIRDDKKIKVKIKISLAQKLLDLLKKEVKKYGK